MENLIIETKQELIEHINQYNEVKPTTANFQALYRAITGYSNIIKNIKGITDLIAFYKGCNLKHEFFQEKLVTEIIKQNDSIIKSSGLLSILINNLGIEDDEQKIDLAIAIIKLRPSMINDLKELSTFINNLNITNDVRKAYLAIAIIELRPSIADLITSKNLSTFIDDLKITDDAPKAYLAIAIINWKPWIINDLRDSTKLSTFIDNLKITDDKQKTDLTMVIREKLPIRQEPRIFDNIPNNGIQPSNNGIQPSNSQRFCSWLKQLFCCQG